MGRAAGRAARRRVRRARAPTAGFAAGESRRRVYGELPGSEAILALVSLGCGVGIVPRIVLEESPLASKVRTLDADDGHDALGEFRVGVCTQRKKLGSPLVQALWDSFRATPARAAAALTSR